MQVAKIASALEHLKSRGYGIVFDDSGTHAKAVLFAAGRNISETCLNEMLSLSASQVYVTLRKERKEAFELAPMQRIAADPRQVVLRQSLPLCESVEAREGIHTGISVADRTATIRILAALESNPKRIVKPGHIFPLEVVSGGVLVKATVFEATADIIDLVFGYEVAAVVDLLGKEGTYLESSQVEQLAAQNDLPLFFLSSLVVYRLRTEKLIEKVAQSTIPLRSGKVFEMSAYRSKLNGVEHIALSLGQDFESGPVLTRVHREKLLVDLFNPLSGETSSMLGKSIAEIEKEGKGLIVYLRSTQQDSFLEIARPLGRDVLFREYGIGAQIIKQSGVKQLELLSTSAVIPEGLENFGLEIKGVRQLKNC